MHTILRVVKHWYFLEVELKTAFRGNNLLSCSKVDIIHKAILFILQHTCHPILPSRNSETAAYRHKENLS